MPPPSHDVVVQDSARGAKQVAAYVEVATRKMHNAYGVPMDENIRTAEPAYDDVRFKT